MIATLTANPCIDKTLSVEKFDLYKMNRVQVLRTDFAGKGINVATVLSNLHVPAICLGFNFPDGRKIMEDQLKRQGIPHRFLEVPGKLRTCTKIFDQTLKHTIEINEFGTAVTPEDGDLLIALAAETAEKCSFITLSGSLPPGLDSDFYFRCIQAVKRVAPHCRVVVDAEKDLLLKALEAGPCFIKPNIHEFEDTFGCHAGSLEELDQEVRNVLDRFPLEMICVSLGADGAFIADRQAAYYCQSVQVEVRSIQGAGDSVVAGMCMALEQGLPLEQVLRCGIAAAGGSVSRDGTQLCTGEMFQSLLHQETAMRQIR
ncbi:MAG: 1-phosphofructokinase family hexose kinase [Lentisphaeria bacterium]|nr:1-phosphofructokinase family hexose kinase [Lentisphaeria bacterium]